MSVAAVRPAYRPHVSYRGYDITPIRHVQGHLIDGLMVHEGFSISLSGGGLNMSPGCTWFQTVKAAKGGIDDLIAARVEQGLPEAPKTITEACTEGERTTFNADAFWGRVRTRKAAERNALRMARLLLAQARGEDVSAEINEVLAEIDDEADTRSTVHEINGTKRRIGPKGRCGLDYL